MLFIHSFLCCFLHHPLIYFLIGSNIFLSTVLPGTLPLKQALMNVIFGSCQNSIFLKTNESNVSIFTPVSFSDCCMFQLMF
jgi:hypothetical protein